MRAIIAVWEENQADARYHGPFASRHAAQAALKSGEWQFNHHTSIWSKIVTVGSGKCIQMAKIRAYPAEDHLRKPQELP